MEFSGLELLDTRPPRDPTSIKGEANCRGTKSEEELEVDWTGEPVDQAAKSEAEEETDWKTIHRFASSSITRGDHSIVGNTIPVIEAREVLQFANDAQEGKGQEGERGKEKVEELMREWFARHDPEDDDNDDLHRWLCPGCKGLI